MTVSIAKDTGVVTLLPPSKHVEVVSSRDTGVQLVLVGPQGPPGPPGIGGISQAAADTRYVNVTGDTMTGGLGIAENVGVGWPSADRMFLGAAGELHVTDIAAANHRPLNVGPPTATTHATTKTYVDSRIWKGTQAAYDAIGTKDPTVLYVVTG